jgi:hypothetical protein
MTTLASTPTAGRLYHRPVATGPAFWGPGDHYTFLVTGEESGGAYLAMEALVLPGGGPPPQTTPARRGMGRSISTSAISRPSPTRQVSR